MTKKIKAHAAGLTLPVLGPSSFSEPDDRAAQHQRWHMLATQDVWRDGECIHKPLLNRNNLIHDPIQFRCGASGCRAGVGSVTVSPAEWQGKPFTWARTVGIAAKSGGRAEGVELCMVLDSVTRETLVQTECARHGLLTIPVTDVLDALPGALEKLQRTGKPFDVAVMPK